MLFSRWTVEKQLLLLLSSSANDSREYFLSDSIFFFFFWLLFAAISSFASENNEVDRFSSLKSRELIRSLVILTNDRTVISFHFKEHRYFVSSSVFEIVGREKELGLASSLSSSIMLSNGTTFPTNVIALTIEQNSTLVKIILSFHSTAVRLNNWRWEHHIESFWSSFFLSLLLKDNDRNLFFLSCNQFTIEWRFFLLFGSFSK